MPTITKPIILNETGINIATANARTAAALEAIVQLMAQDGGGGEGSGTDGFSPIVTITDITGGHRISIRDAVGTKTFDVMDGAAGAKGDTGATGPAGANGVSPTVTVTNITGGHRVAITDATGTKTFDVMDGSGSGSATSNNPTLETEWKDVYSDWAAGYYYDPDNDYAYTQIPSTERTWGVTETYISTSCTPYSNMIPVQEGEEYRYQNMPIHFDSKNAEIPSVIIFDTEKAEIEAYTRTYQDEWTEFTIPTGGVWMAVMYANSQTYYLQKKVAKCLDKDATWNNILADYRSYRLTTPPTPNTLTKALICLGTDDIRPWETKNLHDLYTRNNIPYYMAAIPSNVKACVIDDPYKTNLDYMKLCVQNGGEIICHSADVITEQNKTDFDAMDQYFRKGKEELESYGFKVRGIFKAGGEGSIYDPSDPLIDAWAMHYYEFGDYFHNAFPYNLPRTILEQWESYDSLPTAISTIVQNHGYYIGTFHTYDQSAETAISQILAGLQGYTRGTDYDFVTPSQLFDALMPTTISSGGGSGTDTNTTYSISMSNNVITLTGSDNSTSNVTLPVYDGSSESGGGSGSVSSLTDLSDVSITSPTSGQVLLNNGTGWINANAPWAEITEVASANIFDKNDITTNGGLLPWDGSVMEYEGVFYSYIPCEAGTYTFLTPSWFYTGNTGKIPYYDVDKQYIGEITGTTVEYDENHSIVTITITPEMITVGCAYFGFTENQSLLNSLMVVKGTTYPSSYIENETVRTIQGLQITKSQIVDYDEGEYNNPLSGKILAANGDSICRGVGNNDIGYADIIGANNNMTVQNIGVGGATIATGTSSSHYICSTIGDMRADADYVLLEGGVNDPDFGVSLGTLSEGYTATLDTTTFAGAFETMLKNALTRFPNKKIGYIFVHKCGNFSTNHYNIAKQACEKWGVRYCDLNTQVPPLGYIDTFRTAYTNSGDGYHPNADGYNTFYVPIITAWMKTL